MDVGFLIRGFFIGLSVATVVGPISILCIQRTTQHGFVYGLISGLGVATGDAAYSSIAGFGLTLVATFLVHQQMWIRLLGGLFLVYLGAKTLLTRPATRAAIMITVANLLAAYLSALLLTLTNPLTILSFAAIFAGLGVGSAKNGLQAALLVVCGVFLGSMLWWCVLTGGISLFRTRFTSTWLLWINRTSGLVIVCFGILAVLSIYLPAL